MAGSTLKLSGALKLGQLASPPSDTAPGQLYYDSNLGEFRFYNGTGFVQVADYSGLGATGVSSGAALIGTGSTWSNIAPSSNNVEKVLEAIDSALGAVSSSTPLDNVFRIENSTDNTKKIAFSAAGISTATVRTITMPDANVDLGNLTNSNISASAAIAYSKLNLAASILNADINASAAIAYSKLNLSASIVNADIASAAAIALSKLAALTANMALQSNGSGVISASSVTATELGYVSGVTSAIQTQLNATEKTANKGIANGYASLDSGGKVPVSQLPSTVFEYQGAWDASTNSPALSDATGTSGFVYRTSVAGTQNLGSGSISFNVGDLVIYSGSIWQASPAADGVSSVNGQTGAVTINAINQLTGDVTATAASGSVSKATSVAAIQGTAVSGTTGSGSVVFSASPTITGTLTAAAISASGSLSASNFSGSSSGTNTGDQTITLTGDVTGSGTGSFAATIAAGAVTALKLGTVTDGVTLDQAASGSKLEVKAGGISNTQINASAAIAYSKLNLSASIVNADIASGAAIALNKLAALTASTAVATDTNGFLVSSSTTSAELAFVHGVTSNIQTQLNAKLSSVSQDTAPTLGGNLAMGGFSIISPLQIADSGSTSRYFTEKYVDSSSLTASTTAVAASFTFDSRSVKGQQVFYTILSGTDRRIGRLDIICDAASGTAAANVDITDVSNETGDVGVTWSAAVSGNNIQISYTTNSGTKTMRALVRQFLA